MYSSGVEQLTLNQLVESSNLSTPSNNLGNAMMKKKIWLKTKILLTAALLVVFLSHAARQVLGQNIFSTALSNLVATAHAQNVNKEAPKNTGPFIKPNFEIMTYKISPLDTNYQLAYLFGLYVGYSTPKFNIMLGVNHLWNKNLLIFSTATDYKLRAGIVEFLFGGELGAGYQVVTECTTCKLQFLFAPRFGIAFDLGKNSAIGIISKVIINFSEVQTPYYSLGLEARVGF